MDKSIFISTIVQVRLILLFLLSIEMPPFCKIGFHSFASALDCITNLLFYYNFIHNHSSLSNFTPASVAGVSYTEEQ